MNTDSEILNSFLSKTRLIMLKISRDEDVKADYNNLYDDYKKYASRINAITFLYDLYHYVEKGSISKEDLINEYNEIVFKTGGKVI